MVKEGISVLWATHLIDEVNRDDHAIVLHQGRVLARGTAARITEIAGARDIRSAFIALTQTGETEPHLP